MCGVVYGTCVLRCRRRGLDIRDEVARHLVSRVDRGLHALRRDASSLERGELFLVRPPSGLREVCERGGLCWRNPDIEGPGRGVLPFRRVLVEPIELILNAAGEDVHAGLVGEETKRRRDAETK